MTTYYYAVRARNSIGAGPWSVGQGGNDSMAGTPEAPVLTVTAAGRTSIDLSWTVPNDNGTPIVGYQLERWDNASTNGRCGKLSMGLAATDSNTDTVTEYTDDSDLLARNEVLLPHPSFDGQSTKEAIGQLIRREAQPLRPRTAVPLAPLVLVPKMMTLLLPQYQSTESISARSQSRVQSTSCWKCPMTQAAQASPATTFRSGTAPASAGWMKPPRHLTSYEDRGLARGATYYYRVRAKNSQGNGPWTGYESATTPVAAPGRTGTDGDRHQHRTPSGLPGRYPRPTVNPITDYMLEKWDSGSNDMGHCRLLR